MFLTLQVLSVFLVSIAMALALAHALELPGKMRLGKEAYLTVQPIYYPGFTTAAGFGEGGGMIATLVLLVLSPAQSAAFWWTLAALIALVAMHAAYWLLTHPVNKFWLRDQQLQGFGAGFFAFDPLKRSAPAASHEDSWTNYRDRWEYSHVLRAVLAAISLISLVTGVALCEVGT
jgi:hypothetical protein